MINDIKKYDKNFSESSFLSSVDHIVIMLISSISKRNLDNVKHYLSDNVYDKFNELVTNYKDEKIIRKFDELNIKSSEIINYSINDNIINIKVQVITRYMDYFNDENNKYIHGINDRRIETEHIITFAKKINNNMLNDIIRCESCGHPLNINSNGKCEYCDQVFDMSKYSYIITDIDIF